jgi:O-antigen/teichoic acid export membrane protein
LFVFLSLHVFGVIFAYVISALAALMIARFIVHPNSYRGRADNMRLIRFAAPILLLALVHNLLKHINVFFVKSMLSDNALVGFYTSASTLSMVAYYILAALPLTLLPSVSASIAKKNLNLTRKYIRASLRYVFMLVLPITLLVSATSSNLVAFLYSSEYLAAAEPLKILAFNGFFLLVLAILYSIINASGKPHISLTIVSSLIPILVTLNLILIPSHGLVGAALAITITSLVGSLGASCYVIRKFRALLSPVSGLRIAFASILVYLISLRYQFSGFLIIVTYMIMFSLYFGLLFIMREIKKEDIQTIRSVIHSWSKLRF